MGESDYSDGGIVKDNMIDGCGNGGYYNQFRTLGEITIHNNTITNCDRPIFMRGGDNFHITDNTITGTQNPAFAGISALNGGGDITGNTVTDADGGIAISGIGAGRTLTIEDNTIGFSSDRFPTGAVGIRAENCGATPLSLVGNDVDVVDNHSSSTDAMSWIRIDLHEHGRIRRSDRVRGHPGECLRSSEHLDQRR